MLKLVVATALGLAAPSVASAAELLTNGGFETHSPFDSDNDEFAGWLRPLPPLPTHLHASNVAHAGSSSAAFGTPAAGHFFTSLEQTVQLIPGENYTFSFWLKYDGSGDSQFSILVDSIAKSSLLDPGPFDWTKYTLNFVADSGRTRVGFSAVTTSGHFFVDEASLVGNAGRGVPEPASWALMIAGFGLAGAALRRRQTPAIA